MNKLRTDINFGNETVRCLTYIEIKVVTKSLRQAILLSNILSSKANTTITFKIRGKKHNCAHLSGDQQIFESLVPMVMGNFDIDDDSKHKFAVKTSFYFIIWPAFSS
jgi:hypothetical protein